MKNNNYENQNPVNSQDPMQSVPQGSQAPMQPQAPQTPQAPNAGPAPEAVPNVSSGATIPGGIPKSGYPNSGMPVSGYPASGYGTSAYAEAPKEDKKGLKIAIVILVLILIGILAFILWSMISGNKDDASNNVNTPGAQQPMPMDNGMMPPPPPMEMPVYEPGSIIIDNRDCNGSVDYYRNEDLGMTFFDMKQFFEFVGADVVVTDDVITIATTTQVAVFTVGSNQVEITMKQTGNMRTGFLYHAPYREGDKVYFYIRDLITVFNSASVYYDDNTDVTNIFFATPAPPHMGGMMMPPPQGGGMMPPPPPQGGMYGPPPPPPGYGYAPAPAPQGQNATVETEQAPDPAPQGQPPQGQPPQGQPPRGN